jgi:NAD(P)-dependent dehydrogenase (short-subunit alcohol dehydrogenase family)
MTRTTGRTALVTGASRGLGKAIALALAGAGTNLVLVARDLARLDAVAAECRDHGVRADVFTADLTREEEVAQLAADVARVAPDGPRILVNNAGLNLRKPIEAFTLDEWRLVQDTNLTSVFLVCRAFVPPMKAHGWGRIINMTSMMAHVALPLRTAYCASKAGLLGFTKALALELAPDGITVNGISPGPFATEMNAPLLQDPVVNAQFVSKLPVGRWGRVEEVGALAAYLCSDAAGFITGTDFVIDGGWTAQ